MQNLIGRKVNDGSPGYQTSETIETITQKGIDYDIVFESGAFTNISGDEILELIDDGEIHSNDGNHGGMRVITLLD